MSPIALYALSRVTFLFRSDGKSETSMETRSSLRFTPILSEIRALFGLTYRVARDLLKILIPAIIAVKVLEELGAIALMSRFLAPIMGLVQLPGECGVVFATAILTNIYGAIAVFITMSFEPPLTTGQMSVLGSMLLICHALPTELALTHRVGAHFRYMGPLRFFGALVYGIMLSQIYRVFELFNEPAVIRWTGATKNPSLLQWASDQAWNLAFTILVIFCLMVLMRVLRALRVTNLLEQLLKPLLIVTGISQSAASIAVIGLLAGITFGSGLLLAEIEKNTVAKKDVFLTLAFLSLCHGIVEDTTLILLLGGHYSGILLGRLIFAMAVVSLLARLTWFYERKSERALNP